MADITSNLVGHWPFNGTVNGRVGSNLTVIGGNTAAELFSPGSFGGQLAASGMLLDGANDYFRAGSTVGNFERTSAFSVSCWVHFPSPVAGFTNLVCKALGSPSFQGWRVAIASGVDLGKLALFMNNNGSVSIQVLSNSAVLASAGVYHVVMTYDGSSTAAGVTFYVNNAVVPFSVADNDLNATIISAANFAIGARDADGSGKVAGRMADTRLYLRELSSADVSALYAMASYDTLTNTNNTQSDIPTTDIPRFDLVNWT